MPSSLYPAFSLNLQGKETVRRTGKQTALTFAPRLSQSLGQSVSQPGSHSAIQTLGRKVLTGAHQAGDGDDGKRGTVVPQSHRRRRYFRPPSLVLAGL